MGSVGFTVDIFNAAVFSFSSSSEITAELSSYGANQQSMTSDDNKKMSSFPITASGTKIIVTLSKTYKHALDSGIVALTPFLSLFTATPTDPLVEPLTPNWNETCHALMTFPTYYAAHIGEAFSCKFIDSALAETPLYCELAWDWSIEIWGPVGVTVDDQAPFTIEVSNVIANSDASPQPFQIGFSDRADITTFVEFGTVADTEQTPAFAGFALDVNAVGIDPLDLRSKTTLTADFTLRDNGGAQSSGDILQF